MVVVAVVDDDDDAIVDDVYSRLVVPLSTCSAGSAPVYSST